mgnify:CR=1 FL=1
MFLFLSIFICYDFQCNRWNYMVTINIPNITFNLIFYFLRQYTQICRIKVLLLNYFICAFL